MEAISYLRLTSAYEEYESIEVVPIRVNFKFLQSKKLSSAAAMRFLSVALTIGIFSVAGQAMAIEKIGNSGAGVTNIQRCLKKLGFFNAPVTGKFATVTERAVIGFQRVNRLTPDGVVGGATQRALGQACQSSNPGGNTSGELRFGSRGTNVSTLQQNLQRLGYFNGPITGYFGTETQQAVIRLQRAYGISANGVVGNRTLQAIRNASNLGSDYPVLSQGITSPEVTILQQRLRELGYFNANPTGNFGAITRDAVIAFQRDAGLATTGIVNEQTWNALQGSSQVPNRPNLSNEQVRELQERLRDLSYFNGNPNGLVGPLTRNAIIQFQRDNRLYADGSANIQVLQEVRRVWEDRYANQPSQDFLTVGDRGDNVRTLQERLSQLGFFNRQADGYFDEYTRSSVFEFQQYYQLNPTGRVDRQTWQTLGFDNTPVANRPTNNRRYVVVVPVYNANTLNQVRRYVPGAFQDKSNLGNFVNAGAFGDRASAERQSKMLRSNGLDARVQYL